MNKLIHNINMTHPTVNIFYKHTWIEIDKAIYPLIQELLRAEIETTLSCQNNPDGWIWISFSNTLMTEAFLSILVQDPDFVRADRLKQSIIQGDDWQFKATPRVLGFNNNNRVKFDMAVRFKTALYEDILNSVKQYNKCTQPLMVQYTGSQPGSV